MTNTPFALDRENVADPEDLSALPPPDPAQSCEEAVPPDHSDSIGEDVPPATPVDMGALETQLAALASEVSSLRDLFNRRLLEDKAKNALHQSLQEQSQAISDVLTQRAFSDLFKELLLCIDALSDDDLTLEVAHGTSEDLLEVFRRRGITQIPAESSFDSSVHECVATEPSDTVPAGVIARVVRPGYMLGERVLRPTQVILTAAP